MFTRGIKKGKMKKLNDIIQDSFSYYSFEFSGEPFEGEVIQLNADECRVYFNMEGRGDEHRFRERLQKMDAWFIGKPYKVQQNALSYVAKWLKEK